MSSNLELRTAATKAAIEAFETERDKLLDQLAHLKGHADRLEWVIRVLLAQTAQIEKEEAEAEASRQQSNQPPSAEQEEALQLAKELGNVGSHPSERKKNMASRKKQPEPET